MDKKGVLDLRITAFVEFLFKESSKALICNIAVSSNHTLHEANPGSQNAVPIHIARSVAYSA